LECCGIACSRTEEWHDERDEVVTNNSEEIRLRYLYRKLILGGKIVLSFESTKKLIGPDCAFRLYSMVDSKVKKPRLPERE